MKDVVKNFKAALAPKADLGVGSDEGNGDKDAGGRRRERGLNSCASQS